MRALKLTALALAVSAFATPALAETPFPYAATSEWYRFQAAIHGDRSVPHMQSVRERFFTGPGAAAQFQATPDWVRTGYQKALDEALAAPRSVHGTPTVNGIRASYLARMAHDYHQMGLAGDLARQELAAAREAHTRALLQGYGLPHRGTARPTTALELALRDLEKRGVTHVSLVDRGAVETANQTVRAARVPWELRHEMHRHHDWMLRQPRMQVSDLRYMKDRFAGNVRDAGAMARHLAQHPAAPRGVPTLQAIGRSLRAVRGGPGLLIGAATLAAVGLAALTSEDTPTTGGAGPAPAAGGAASMSGSETPAAGSGTSPTTHPESPAAAAAGAPVAGELPGDGFEGLRITDQAP